MGAKKAVGHIASKRWWPTVRDTIVVLAGGRHLGWAALGSHLQTKIWHFAMAFAI